MLWGVTSQHPRIYALSWAIYNDTMETFKRYPKTTLLKIGLIFGPTMLTLLQINEDSQAIVG
jgi:hypothetical protein